MNSSNNTWDGLSDVEISDEIEGALDKMTRSIRGANIFSNNGQIYPSVELNRLIGILPGIDPRTKYDDESVWRKTRECVRWAQALWLDALSDDRLGRAFVAYLVVEHLGNPSVLLDWSISEESRRRLATSSTIDGGDMNIPASEGYFGEQVQNAYIKGLEEKDALKLVYAFERINRGAQLNGFGSLLPKLLQFVYRLHPAGLNKVLSSQKPAITYAVILSLAPSDLANFLATECSEDDLFAYIWGLIVICRDFKNVRDSNILKDTPAAEVSTILQKIIESKEWNHSLRQLADEGNLKWNPLFHYACGSVLGRKIKLLDEYLDLVDFSLEHTGHTDCFTLAVRQLSDVTLVNEISAAISKRYLTYLTSENYRGQINRATGYFGLLCQFIRSTWPSTENFTRLIESVVDRIQHALDSWHPHRASLLLRKLYCICSTNFLLLHNIPEEDAAIRKLETFTLDERHSFLFAPIEPEFIRTLLTCPETIERLPVRHENGMDATLMRIASK